MVRSPVKLSWLLCYGRSDSMSARGVFFDENKYEFEAVCHMLIIPFLFEASKSLENPSTILTR